MWSVDTSSYSVANRMGPTTAGFTVTKMQSINYDPVGHDVYIVYEVTGVAGRLLGKMDVNTGVITQVGNLGMKFATISFRKDGQMFGVTGNGQLPNPETLFLIDKNTAATTLAIALGNGADGEIISYNYDDDMFYHWSGNSTMVFEKFPANTPYTPVTNIPTVGVSSGETFGAIYLGNNNFIISNISSQFKHVNANGSYGNVLFNAPDDMRGMAMPPRFAFDADTVCPGDTVNWFLMPGQARDTAVYHWGDGTSTTVFPAGSASHVYASAGNFTTYAILKNDSVGEDTMTSAPIRIFALPLVNILPGADTLICLADSVNLVASNGGTSQWYMNGTLLAGDTVPTLTVTTNGWYNMTKTNLNGCSDSAAVGIRVTFGDQPFVDLGADSTICDGDTVCITLPTIPGETFLWSTGSTNNTECLMAAGAYSVLAMDSVGCTESDTVQLTVVAAPNPTIGTNSLPCPTIDFVANDPNGLSWAWDFGDGGTGTGANVSHTYTANGTYTITLVASNSCFNITVNEILTINCIIGIDNSLGNAVRISPNPSNGDLMLNAILPSATSLSYAIRDLSGRLLLQKSNDDVRATWSEAIHLNAASGMYFLTVKAGEDMAVYRLIIE